MKSLPFGKKPKGRPSKCLHQGAIREPPWCLPLKMTLYGVNFPVLHYYREQPGSYQGATRTHFFDPPVIYHQDIWAIFANVNNQFGLFTTHCLTNSTYFIAKVDALLWWVGNRVHILSLFLLCKQPFIKFL